MKFEVAGSDGRPVRAVSHGPADAPAVLVAHGFKGFMDWGPWSWLCDQLAAAGLRAIRFDFSHNGVEERDFDRLDLFMLDTTTRHQEDLRALAAAVEGPLGLLGHSRGGGDVLLFAGTEPRVRTVATLASVATTEFMPPDGEKQLRTQGFYAYPNARTKQLMPMARHAFDDGASHSIQVALGHYGGPLLLVHGESDEAVPFSSMQTLAGWATQAQTMTIEGAGHTFGAVHPFQGPTPDLERIAARLATWFGESLLA